jgi:hypothetical protein
MMRSFHIVVAGLLCAGALRGQRTEGGTYVMYQGGAEVTRESFSFDGATLTDTVRLLTRGIRLESVARYDAQHSPESYLLLLYEDSLELPVQQVDVTFSDTAAIWSTHAATGDSSGVARLDGPVAFMQNLVFAHLAVVLLKYDHAVGGTQTLDVWMPEGGAALIMQIEFASGRDGTVDFAGTTMNVEVDETGWLRRATVPAQNVTIESMNRSSHP